jgi:hypothetical protein
MWGGFVPSSYSFSIVLHLSSLLSFDLNQKVCSQREDREDREDILSL